VIAPTASSVRAELLARPPRSRYSHTTAPAVLATVSVMVMAVAIPDWSGWSPLLLLLAPATAAWTMRRRSMLVTIYLAQIAVDFGLTGLLLDSEHPPMLVALVVLWTSGLAIGGLLAGTGSAPVTARRWSVPRWPQFLLTAGLIAVSAWLVLTGQLGVQAQLTLGLSTPVGILGALSTTAPVMTVILVVCALASQRGVPAAAALLIAQTTVLSLSGFRGAAASFVVSVACAAAITLPSDSPWRRPRRIALTGATLVAVAVIGFIAAANVKDRVATDLGASSAGTRLFGIEQTLPMLSARLDSGAPLQRAIDLNSDSSVQEAVSWSAQAEAIVPRFLWPDKPVIDYGRQVAASAYGLRHLNTSSTLSTLGDTFINVKVYGVAIVAMLLGFALNKAERMIRNGVGLPTLVIAGVLSVVVVGQEEPLILALVGLVRNTLLASALLLACSATYRIFHSHPFDSRLALPPPE
jgi:hypothetical protein